MTITLKDLMRTLSRACYDYVGGIATGGTATTLSDTRLGATFNEDDVFNGGVLVLNEGGGNMIWTTDCETTPVTTDFTSVTVTDTACRVHRDDTYKYNGKWSIRCTTGSDASDQAYADKTLASTYTTIYGQAMVYVEDTPVGPYDLLTLAQAGGTAILAVRITSAGALSVYNTPATMTYTPDTATTVTADTWHRLEIGATINDTAGTVDLWWDGVQILSRRSQNTGATAVGRIMLGIKNTSDASSRTVWFDAVKVDQEYIGTRIAETEKTITDYAYSTGTLTWSGNIVAPTANVTRYSIYDWPKVKWQREQKKQAINDAIQSMWPWWFKRKVNPETDSGTASISIQDNTFLYPLPSDCESVLEVFLQPSTTSSPYGRITRCAVRGTSGSRYLYLPDAKSYTSGRKVRIVYLARPTPLINDNDELAVDEAFEGAARRYIINTALGMLWEALSSPSEEDARMSQKFYNQAEEIRRKYKMPRPQSTIALDVPEERELSFAQRIDPEGIMP